MSLDDMQGESPISGLASHRKVWVEVGLAVMDPEWCLKLSYIGVPRRAVRRGRSRFGGHTYTYKGAGSGAVPPALAPFVGSSPAGAGQPGVRTWQVGRPCLALYSQPCLLDPSGGELSAPLPSHAVAMGRGEGTCCHQAGAAPWWLSAPEGYQAFTVMVADCCLSGTPACSPEGGAFPRGPACPRVPPPCSRWVCRQAYAVSEPHSLLPISSSDRNDGSC